VAFGRKGVFPLLFRYLVGGEEEEEGCVCV
jgi:hypothetical protein